MGKLLRFEFRKLFHKTSFYVCGSVILIMLLAILGTTRAVESQIGDSLMSAMDLLPQAMVGSSIIFILAVFVALFVCEDHHFHTYKNVLTKGYSRPKTYLAKYIVTMCATGIFCLLTYLSIIVIATIIWKFGDGFGLAIIEILAAQMLVVAAYASVFFLVAVLIKSSGSAIAVGIVGTLLTPGILSLIEYWLDLKTDILSQYWLDDMLLEISKPSVESSVLLKTCLIAGVYIIVSLGGGLLWCRRYEV